nr:T9SS type A sorting domain-containing protein [Sunxiuqinia sp.]
SYNKAASSDSYTAYFDDLLITTENLSVSTGITEFTKKGNRVFFANSALNFVDTPLHSEVTIYTISGVAVEKIQLNSNRIPIRLPNGIYLVSVSSKNKIYTQKVPIFKH